MVCGRYWEGITNLKTMHSKWFDACMQIIAFDQILCEDLSPRKDPFCRHVCTLFIQLSAMASQATRTRLVWHRGRVGTASS